MPVEVRLTHSVQFSRSTKRTAQDSTKLDAIAKRTKSAGVGGTIKKRKRKSAEAVDDSYRPGKDDNDDDDSYEEDDGVDGGRDIASLLAELTGEKQPVVKKSKSST